MNTTDREPREELEEYLEHWFANLPEETRGLREWRVTRTELVDLFIDLRERVKKDLAKESLDLITRERAAAYGDGYKEAAEKTPENFYHEGKIEGRAEGIRAAISAVRDEFYLHTKEDGVIITENKAMDNALDRIANQLMEGK
jgi:flagellar biosynthesis/type III secretory pathway protein FliH